MKNEIQSKLGFTLIELLVVVLIIGILAAVALPQYQVAVLKSRYTQMQTLGKSLKDAENAYYMANNKWTKKLDELDIDLPANFTLNSDKTQGTWDKFAVYIYLSSTENHGAVEFTYDSRLKHIIYFGDSTNIYCRAKQGDKTAQSVCKNFGGTYTNTYGGYDEYTITVF